VHSSKRAISFAGLLALAAALSWAGPAAAQNVSVQVIVSHASQEQGPMEQPKLLPPGFDFQSHKVLQQQTLSLGMGQEGRTSLPNGKAVKLRPESIQGNQLMMHVEVEGATKSDLRMRNGKRVTIRHPQRYENGNLLVHLEARF
jgi:hypothetical protein